MTYRECTIEGCFKNQNGRGFCQMHYSRWAKYGDPHGGVRLHAPPEERFMRRVEKTEGCWNWSGAKSRSGYGSFQPGGHKSPTTGAHRFSYEMHKGPIPPGLFVMHACDNKLCVNPDHLSLGTAKENTADMIAKGRKAYGKYALGEEVGCAVLTAERVREIRNSTETNKAIADRFGVSVNAVRYARTGKTWKHID